MNCYMLSPPKSESSFSLQFGPSVCVCVCATKMQKRHVHGSLFAPSPVLRQKHENKDMFHRQHNMEFLKLRHCFIPCPKSFLKV